MAISQETIDEHLAGSILKNNPNGGAGDDYSEYCQVLSEPEDEGKPLLWKPNEDTPDDSPLCHHVGINCPTGYSVAWKVTSLDYSYIPIPLNGEFGRVVGIGFINLRGDSFEVPINVADSTEETWIWGNGNDTQYEVELKTADTSDTVETRYYSLPGNIQVDALYVRTATGEYIDTMVVYVIYDPRDNVITCTPKGDDDFTLCTDGVWESISVRALDGTANIQYLQINEEYVIMNREPIYNSKPIYVHYLVSSDWEDEDDRIINRSSPNAFSVSDTDVHYEVQLHMVARSEIEVALSMVRMNFKSSLNKTLKASAPKKVLLKAESDANEAEQDNAEVKPINSLSNAIKGYTESDKNTIINCITNKRKELIELIKDYEKSSNKVFSELSTLEQLSTIGSLCIEELK